MSAARDERTAMTFDEYLAFDAASDIRHEFVGGYVYAMTGGSVAHAKMIVAISAAVYPVAQAQGCVTVSSDARLRTGDFGGFYPDVMVTCDASDDDPRYLTRPCLLVEVLSPSSLERDRETKLGMYLALDSLKAYLVVDPSTPRIEAHVRSLSGEWQRPTTHYEGEQIEVPCPQGLVLSVDGLYA